MEIGVLALQGDFLEHKSVLEKMGVTVRLVRLAGQLTGLSGLILPGGESTTIGKLAVAYQLLEPLREFGMAHPVWGTCAGAIFLSKDTRCKQPLLELMDIRVTRNAFGRQVDSFEIDLNIPELGFVNGMEKAFHAVFIRAPIIESVGEFVQVLSTLPDGRIVAARQGQLLATAFHPELTKDERFHRYFLEMTKSA